jgi:hypothetical protein
VSARRRQGYGGLARRSGAKAGHERGATLSPYLSALAGRGRHAEAQLRAFDPKPDNPAVAQLVHLHADLGGKLLDHRNQAKRLTADMKHVEAVIRLFDPGYDTRRIAVKRRNRTNSLLRKGTAWRNAIDVLRAAEKPLTVREVSAGVDREGRHGRP